MDLLLDTHIAVWSLVSDPRLSTAARNLLSDPANRTTVSVVALWEIAIKRTLFRGRHTLFPHSAEETHRLLIESGVAILPVTPKHTFAVEALPPLHRDPFDRLLVAQALVEPLRLVTHDPQIAAYSETVILV